MNNTRAAEVNTQAASPESISTPPKPVGSAAVATFRGNLSGLFPIAEEVVNKKRLNAA
jgi:hypothetical protein